MTLSTEASVVAAVVYGIGGLLAVAGLRLLATAPRLTGNDAGARRFATPVLPGRTLEERLLAYVERRNTKRSDFDDFEAAVALGSSTDEIDQALHALQRKGLVKSK